MSAISATASAPLVDFAALSVPDEDSTTCEPSRKAAAYQQAQTYWCGELLKCRARTVWLLLYRGCMRPDEIVRLTAMAESVRPALAITRSVEPAIGIARSLESIMAVAESMRPALALAKSVEPAMSAVATIDRFKAMGQSDPVPVLNPATISGARSQRMLEAMETMCHALKEASEREETMISELAQMRRAAVRADEREAAAVQRADAAERRARRSDRLTIAIGLVSAVAAVVAIFITG